jgi:tetratricopeptide (TPR) repeat protein
LPFPQPLLTAHVTPLCVLLRFNQTDDVMKFPQPAADHRVITAWWHFARGVSLARTDKIDATVAERAALVQEISRVSDSALFGGTGLESAKTILGLATVVLDARLAWARGAREEAIALWTKAVAAADRVPYDEPPIWFYPVRESLGAALVLADKPSEAERVFREDLERHPRNPRSLFGLRESLLKQGKDADAAWVQQAFEDAWKDADVTITLDSL